MSSAGPEQVEASAVLHALAEPRRVELRQLLGERLTVMAERAALTSCGAPCS